VIIFQTQCYIKYKEALEKTHTMTTTAKGIRKVTAIQDQVTICCQWFFCMQAMNYNKTYKIIEWLVSVLNTKMCE
jgi:hypothetical protein